MGVNDSVGSLLHRAITSSQWAICSLSALPQLASIVSWLEIFKDAPRFEVTLCHREWRVSDLDV